VRRRRLFLAVASLLAALAYWSPALWNWTRTGYGDWQQFHHQWEAARVAVLRYGEFPLWNPWHCGGVFLFGDPQAQVYSPLFWLLLPLGTTVGSKLFLILHSAAGFAGMYVLARRQLRVSVLAAAMASLVWAGSGFFAWHGSGGHSAFLPFYFAPWLLLAWRRAVVQWRWSAAVAASMALVLLEGGVYPFPYFCLLLLFDGLVQMTDPGRRWGVVRAGAVTLPLMLALGSFRLIPILHTLARYPRPTAGDDKLTFAEFLDLFTLRDYEYHVPGHEYVWAEYGAFIGWTALALGVVGLVLAIRRHPSLVLGALLFGGLTLGHVTDWHPWALLHELPVYGSLRVPSRFAVLFLFYLALGAALATDALARRLAHFRGRCPVAWPRAIPAVLLVLVAGDIAWGNGRVIARWNRDPLPPIDRQADYRLLPFTAYRDYASFPARGVSNRGCYTGMTAYHAARDLVVGPRPQVRVDGGRLLAYRRTANTMTAEVQLERPGTLRFNQTWAVGWRSNLGTVEASPGGSIVVRSVPAGRHTVVLRYVPDDLLAASIGGVLGLILTLAVAFFPRRRRRRRRSVASPGPSPHAPAP